MKPIKDLQLQLKFIENRISIDGRAMSLQVQQGILGKGEYRRHMEFLHGIKDSIEQLKRVKDAQRHRTRESYYASVDAKRKAERDGLLGGPSED